METQVPGKTIDPISIEINQLIDRLILSLEQRRAQLLTDLSDKKKEAKENLKVRQQMELELGETKEFIERQIKHNKLHTMQGRMIRELEATMKEMQVTGPIHQEVRFLCDAQKLEEHISRLGEIVQLDIPPKPAVEPINHVRVAAFHPIPHTPVVPLTPNYAFFDFINERSGPGELNKPRGVSIDSKHIYVADMYNSRIQIFSHTGGYIKTFGSQELNRPHGILVNLDSIYVTDRGHNAIFLFKLPHLAMIKRVGKSGNGNEEFNKPGQLAISPNKHLYVPDANNNRIQIYSTNLLFKGSLKHKTMTTPIDVKFSEKEMFVLSINDSPCIHVFTLSGEKSRSLVTRGYGKQVKGASFFCLYKQDKIVICDEFADNLKVFSVKGNLLHTKGEYRHEARRFHSPAGIAVNNNKVVCVCDDCENCENSLHIFSI